MINILYQFNEKYVPYAGVSITSLLENNKDADNITIYLLGEGITDESKEKLLRQIDIYGRRGIFLDAADLIEEIKNIGLDQYRGSYAANVRMFVNNYIPDTVDRLLYLDCDTIIVNSLSSLFRCDMKNKPAGMVLDSMCMNHKQDIGFSKEDLYFNSGVILFNMPEWRRQQCQERIVDHIRNIRSHYIAPDQDVLNIVLKKQIRVLDAKYNFQPFHMVYPYKLYMRLFGQPHYYSKSRVEKANNDTIIYHTFRFLGEFPWHKNSLHPATKVFDKYISKSLWKDYIKRNSDNNIIFKIERTMYRFLPKSVFIFFFKICYELYLWKSNKDSLKA